MKSVLLNLFIISLGLLIVGCNSSNNSSTSLAENGIVATQDSNNKIESNSPEIILNGDTVVTLNEGEPYTELGASAKNANVIVSGGVNSNKEGTYLVTYIVEDKENNIKSATRTVIVKPVAKAEGTSKFELNGSATVVLVKGQPYKEKGTTDASVKPKGEVDTNKTGIYTLVYTAPDNRVKTRTVIVVPPSDSPKPEIELIGGEIIELPQGSDYKEFGVFIGNEFYRNLNEGETPVNYMNYLAIVEMVGGDKVNKNKVGRYKITYKVIDAVNNSSKIITRTVNVVDKTPPIVTLNGKENITLAQGASYTDKGAKVVNNNPTNNENYTETEKLPPATGEVNTDIVDIYTLIYKTEDSAGNLSNEVIRTVQVLAKEDPIITSKKPVITLNGGKTISHPQGETYTDLGATATDANGAAIYVNIDKSLVDISKVGEYEVIYTAKDSEGNKSEVKRTIKVEDQTPPDITLKGLPIITLAQGETYQEPGVTVTDNNDPKEKIKILFDGKVNINKVGIYELGYTAKDSVDNKSKSITRIVNVVDKTAPVITLNLTDDGKETVVLAQGEPYKELGATAKDNNDENLKVEIDYSKVDKNKVGVYYVIYTVKDKAGNVAHNKIRTVEVIDKTPPEITLNLTDDGKETVILTQGGVYKEYGATAKDYNDGIISVEIDNSAVDTSEIGEYKVIYTAKDKAGNSAVKVERIVKVEGKDKTAPIFTSENIATVSEGQTEAITLQATDDNTVSYLIIDTDSKDFDVDSTTGAVTFKKPPKYSEKNKFTFTAIASDGTNNATQLVTILVSIAALDDNYTLTNYEALLDVLSNDGTNAIIRAITSEPSYGSVTIENGKIHYIAKTGYIGTDSFEYEIKGSNNTLDTATVSLVIPDNIDTPTTRSKLNDTGITQCGDYAYDASGNHSNNEDCSNTEDGDGDSIPIGQDGHFGRDKTNNNDTNGHAGFNFTKLDENGIELVDQSVDYAMTPWSCIKDNVTGLIWEVKSNSNSDLHNKSDTYTWYNTDTNTNGGHAGEENSNGDHCFNYNPDDSKTYCNTQAYVERVNVEGYCGAKDWRLPTKEELRSLVDYSISYPSPTIDTAFFPNTIDSLYWSSSPYAGGSDVAWPIYFLFYGGSDNVNTKANEEYVRLVRSGQ